MCGACRARFFRDAGDGLPRREGPAFVQGPRDAKALPLCLRGAVGGDALGKHRELFRASALTVRPVGNLVVVKTLPGSASNAGVAVDELAFREVAGSIAGDDTLLLICESAEDGKAVAERLLAVIKG